MLKIIGHRAFAGLYPENSLLAISKVLTLADIGIELDIQLSACDTWLLFHDEYLQARTNYKGCPETKIADLNFSELAKLDIGSHFAPKYKNEYLPSLKQALALIKTQNFKAELNLELKIFAKRPKTQALLELLALVREFELNIIFSSFDYQVLTELRKLSLEQNLEIKLAYLSENFSHEILSLTKKLGAQSLNLAIEGLNPEIIALIKAENLACYAYTLNDPSQIYAWQQAGLTGVFTDRPDLMPRIL